MNLKQCRDWTSALAGLGIGKLSRLSNGLGRWGERPGERWEAGLSSRRGFSSLQLRLHGSLRASLAQAHFKTGVAAGREAPARDPFPAFRLDWSVERDRLEAATFYRANGKAGHALAVGADRRAPLRAEAWSAKWLSANSEIAPLIAGFSALCPIEHVILGEASVSLRLAEATPWPRFARLDVIKPWEAKGAQLSRLFSNLKVRELLFQPGDLTIFVHS